MIDPAIKAFFIGKKEEWLKKNTKSSMTELELEEKSLECEDRFAPDNWLPDAARRAGQISMATHPCTFSHPSARKNKNGYVTPVVSAAGREADGFLRSGNVAVNKDALGNAAALDVYKFLTLKLQDDRMLLEHIQSDSQSAVELLTIQSETYEVLKSGFLEMVESEQSENAITSSKIKQVYFPSFEGYHQLSLLSNSGIIYKLRKRIDDIRFSDEVKEQRKRRRDKIFSEHGFMELYDLTMIGYGGTKPQNISVFNNQNGGKAYLLRSAPPVLQKRYVYFPKENFFKNSFYQNEYRDVFEALHQLFKTNYNNVNIREGRDYRLQELMTRIIGKMWAVRGVAKEQYRPEKSRLKPYQKIWLCEEHSQVREEENEWLDKLCNEISVWTIRTYKKLFGKQAITLGDDEHKQIVKIINQNREALR